MEKHNLPKSRPTRQDLSGLTSDVDQFLPRTLSKQGAKRERQALEETRIRVVVLKGLAILERLGADYRFNAKRYELTRFIDEADYYVSLIDRPRTEGGKNIARQAVQQFTDDLYLFIWGLSQDADESTRQLIAKDLYPEKEEERSWMQSLGIWLGKGGL